MDPGAVGSVKMLEPRERDATPGGHGHMTRWRAPRSYVDDGALLEDVGAGRASSV
jgi:hypothetical protein